MSTKIRFTVHAAVIAALYVVFTILANLFGLSSNVIQVRFSEALAILPLFTPAAIPGLFLGCFLGNILTGCMILDVIFGSLSTLIGALGTYYIGKKVSGEGLRFFLGVLPPIVVNTMVIPEVLIFVYKLEGALHIITLSVFAGEVISCGVCGYLLCKVLKKHRKYLF